MPDTYAQLLDALGFNAADAADAVGSTQRGLESSQAQIRLAGEDDRQAIKSRSEAKGVLSSGEHMKRIARQRAGEASALTEAEVGAADRVAAINRELQRAQAQNQLREEEQATSRSINDQRWALEQQLLSQQQSQAQSAGSFDPAALLELLGGSSPVAAPKPRTGPPLKPQPAVARITGWWG